MKRIWRLLIQMHLEGGMGSILGWSHMMGILYRIGRIGLCIHCNQICFQPIGHLPLNLEPPPALACMPLRMTGYAWASRPMAHESVRSMATAPYDLQMDPRSIGLNSTSIKAAWGHLLLDQVLQVAAQPTHRLTIDHDPNDVHACLGCLNMSHFNRSLNRKKSNSLK